MPFGVAEKSRNVLFEDLPLLEHEHVIAGEVANFRFLSGTIVWLDITSSITMGTAPKLLPYHTCILAFDSQIKLEEFMGCKNWAMLQIGRISALQERKIQAMRQEHFDCTELQHTVADIDRQIQSRLALLALEVYNISERGHTARLEPMSDIPMLVTHVFAYMESLYLHLVPEGFQKPKVLDKIISEAMRMLQTQIPTVVLPALVTPLYVVGSVARQGDEQFFRDIFSPPLLLDSLLKHQGKILPILEEIWSKRRTTPLFAWEDSLELTHDILLL